MRPDSSAGASAGRPADVILAALEREFDEARAERRWADVATLAVDLERARERAAGHAPSARLRGYEG